MKLTLSDSGKLLVDGKQEFTLYQVADMIANTKNQTILSKEDSKEYKDAIQALPDLQMMLSTGKQLGVIVDEQPEAPVEDEKLPGIVTAIDVLVAANVDVSQIVAIP